MKRLWMPSLAIWLVVAFAASTRAQPSGDVKEILCAADGITRCDEAEYSDPMSIDVDADGTAEHIYVLRRGGDELCHVRHACFTILQRRGVSWRILLRGVGGSVGTRGTRRHRDLVVVAANSADEHEYVLYRYRYRDRRYTRLRRRTCSLDDRHPGCRPPDGEVVLQ